MSTTISFSNLKKELKGIEKLSKENLDIKSWASELQLWMQLQDESDPQKIFLACVLTSTGEPRRIIQDLQEINSNDEEEIDDDNEENSDSETNETYPSFDEIVDALENFYGTKEDQNLLLRELRAMKINRNEKVKDFNIKYRSLYLKLDKKRKRQISVLDYADSLQNNPEAWKRIAMKDDISLTKAFTIAEKVDRLMIKNNFNTTNNLSHNNQYHQRKNQQTSINFKKKEEPKTVNSDKEMEDLTRRMRNLTIRVCYFCKEKGHMMNSCPKLKEEIEKNREEILKERYLK